MQIQDITKRLQNETGIYLTRSRFYHYDRMGLLGEIGRLGNRYRDFNEDSYLRLKFIVMMSDVGIKLTDIKDLFEGNIKGLELILKLKQKNKNILACIEMLTD